MCSCNVSVIDLDDENFCNSQMGQDKVSGGVSVICCYVTPIAMFYENLS